MIDINKRMKLEPIDLRKIIKPAVEITKTHVETKITREYIIPLLLREWPTTVNYGFLRYLFSSQDRVNLSVHLERIKDEMALTMIQRELANIKAELMTTSETSFKYSKLSLEYNSASQLRDLISARKTHLYRMKLTLTVKGRNYKEAKERLMKIESILKAMNFTLSKGYYRGWETHRATLPIAYDEIPYDRGRIVHTDVVTAAFPFISEYVGVFGDNMLLYGINDLNNTPVFIDRFKLASYNMLVFGKTGSGKSYFEKLTMLRSYNTNPRTIIYAIDPLDENFGLFKSLGGVNIDMWQSREIINPLDLKYTLGDVHAKVRDLIGALDSIFDFTAEEKALLDVTLTRLYREKKEPIMSDLIAKCAEDSRLQRVHSMLQVFESGTLEFLNTETTLTLNENMVNFALGRVPENLRGFFMSLVLEFIYSHIRQAEHEVPKLIYVDEVHHVWTHKETAEMLEWMARHTRHYNAGMTLLTQSANDAFLNKHTRAIMENTELHLLFYHDHITDEMRRFYKFIPGEERYLITRHNPKENGYSIGILRLGLVKIPIRIYASKEEDHFIK